MERTDDRSALNSTSNREAILLTKSHSRFHTNHIGTQYTYPHKPTITMKFTVAASILLSAPAALGYTPNANFHQPIRQQTTTAASSSALGYAADVVQTPTIELTATDDASTAALKNTLGYSEGAVREEYSNWLMQYGQVADESRYMTYKKNLLMQEEYNQRVGAAFTLNEYGDMTARKLLLVFHLVALSDRC
jgi:hypothetical protein